MLRLDPNGEYSAEEVIGKLTEILANVPVDSPRAQKLTEMIRGLRKIEAWQQPNAGAEPARP